MRVKVDDVILIYVILLLVRILYKIDLMVLFGWLNGFFKIWFGVMKSVNMMLEIVRLVSR